MAAVRKVKCKYCGIQFDRNAEPSVEVGGRRYAHKACAERFQAAIPQDEQDYIELENYIKKLFNEKNLNVRIRKQIKDFKEEYGYTFSGMFKTLYWWYEIKGHSIDQAQGGIGIIPYIYDEALKYYYSLYLAQMVNQARENFQPIVKEVEIGSPRVRANPVKLFDFNDGE